MLDNLFNEAYALTKEYDKVSCVLLQRKFKINSDRADKLLNLIRIEKWKEARKLAKEVECNK